MSDVFRTFIIPSASVSLARSIAAGYGASGQGMFTTGLSASGSEPATHYVSTGLVPSGFTTNLPLQVWEHVDPDGWNMVSSTPGDPVAVYQNATAGGVSCTQADVDLMFSSSDFTDQQPFDAFSRLGLKIVAVQEEI